MSDQWTDIEDLPDHLQKRIRRRERCDERSRIDHMQLLGFIEGDDTITNRIRRLTSPQGYRPSPACVLLGHKWADSDRYDYHDTMECARKGCEGHKIAEYE